MNLLRAVEMPHSSMPVVVSNLIAPSLPVRLDEKLKTVSPLHQCLH